MTVRLIKNNFYNLGQNINNNFGNNIFNTRSLKKMEELLNEIEILKIEYEKFCRGNKSAGTRARKCLQNIKQIAQNIRVEIQNSKKS